VELGPVANPDPHEADPGRERAGDMGSLSSIGGCSALPQRTGGPRRTRGFRVSLRVSWTLSGTATTLARGGSCAPAPTLTR
jgi:hypothetical protein